MYLAHLCKTDVDSISLKTEVIAQGIELQRRWIREIKMRVKAFSYVYRMTNDTKWVDRTWLELQVRWFLLLMLTAADLPPLIKECGW